MNKHTETLDGAYVVVTTRATGRVRLQLGHAMHMPIDKTEMSAQQARDVAQALIQAAVLLDLNAGAGVRSTDSPQRQECACECFCGDRGVTRGKECKGMRQVGRVNWAMLLLLLATVVGWASIIQVGGHRLGWW